MDRRDILYPAASLFFIVAALMQLITGAAPEKAQPLLPTGTPTKAATAPTGTPSPTGTNTPVQTITRTLRVRNIFTPTVEVITDTYFALQPYPFMRDPDDWTVSADGVLYVSFWEGYVATPYDDGGQPGVGNCTIGYGHLLHLGPCTGGESPRYIGQAEALKLLEAELNHCGGYVAKYTKARLTQTQYNILTGLVCGWGYDKYAKSEVLALLNGGQYFAAAEKLKTTAIYGIGIGLCPGLVRRRKVEARMFVQPPLFVMWPFTE